MERNFKKTLLIIFAICMLLPVVSYDGNLNAFATAIYETSTVDLSSYRKTYISNDNTDNKAYYSTTPVAENNLLFESLTGLSICSNKTDTLSQPIKDQSKGVPVITVYDASDVSIYLFTKNITKDGDFGNNYKLSFDSFGNTQTGDRTPKITASGNTKVFTGQIGTGALVVQKSYDGVTYTQTQLDKFNNGYYTTNYLDAFGGQNKEIFTPSGDDIKRGVYISVNFYFEAYRYEYIRTDYYYEWWQYLPPFGLGMIGGPQGKTEIYDNVYKNIRESYTFFIIEDSVETVSFNNMTTADTSEIVEVAKPNSKNIEEYKSQSEQYNNYLSSVIDRILPTMYDGDMTTTGFRINVTANPYVLITIKRNGEDYQLPSLKLLTNEGNQKVYEITQKGKYDITISSYSKRKTLTLYVDNVTPNEAYQRYFGKQVMYKGQTYGDKFLDYSPNNIHGNMRAFDAYSKVPVFIGTLNLRLQEHTDLDALPLYGVITNKSTGKVSVIEENQISLTELGEYEAIFFTNADYYDYVVLGNSDIKMSGDVRVYKFNFKLIGKDSDTTVNEQLLSTSTFKDLSIASPSDYAPMFYGVTRTSADKGKIIVAFSDRESALKYAKKVVLGEIETHIDAKGNTFWRIPNIENPLGAKVNSYSGWQNAQTVKALSEQITEKLYFDLTISASYLTLEKSVEEFEQEGTNLMNLHLEALKKSVIVWYNAAQRGAAMAVTPTIEDISVVKFIGKQNTAVLSKNNQGIYSEVNENNFDYRFVKDVLGIDSYTLTAEDMHGNKFLLNYEDGFYAQLKSHGCKSGLILITETNIYGCISAKYYIYYIEEGYQPAKILLNADGQQMQITNGKTVSVKPNKKVLIKNVCDYVDPYSYIRIKHSISNNTTTDYYSISDAIGLEFAVSGNYEIAVIDRFGNSLLCQFAII